MKSINQKTTQILTAIIFLFGIQFNALAGKRIDGNGTIITSKKTLEKFHSIEIETFCNVTVNNGAMLFMELKTDENILDKLDIRVENGILKVSTEYWLEATILQLTISTPFITSFKNSGWGKIKIRDLETDHFELFGKTGNIYLEGTVNELDIIAGTGNIDASKMIAKRITVDKSGHGKIQINASETLTINGNTKNIFHSGKPIIIKNGLEQTESITDISEKKKVEYVTVKIKNNSLLNMGFVIRGPKEREFSYGFSLFPFSTKKEKVPVGTRFFEKTIHGEKLLYTISQEDNGNTINLFN